METSSTSDKKAKNFNRSFHNNRKKIHRNRKPHIDRSADVESYSLAKHQGGSKKINPALLSTSWIENESPKEANLPNLVRVEKKAGTERNERFSKHKSREVRVGSKTLARDEKNNTPTEGQREHLRGKNRFSSRHTQKVETTEDIQRDITRIEKEIWLEISDISSLSLN